MPGASRVSRCNRYECEWNLRALLLFESRLRVGCNVQPTRSAVWLARILFLVSRISRAIEQSRLCYATRKRPTAHHENSDCYPAGKSCRRSFVSASGAFPRRLGKRGIVRRVRAKPAKSNASAATASCARVVLRFTVLHPQPPPDTAPSLFGALPASAPVPASVPASAAGPASAPPPASSVPAS